MPRYSGWRRLSGETADRPDLLDLGKRLLGYLAEQRKLSGVTTCSKQAKAPDGSIVRARFVGDLPSIEVKAAAPNPDLIPLDVGGFVTWPTDAAGNTALPDSARVILAGEKFEQVRQSRYARVFPDVHSDPDDPDSPMETGLAHAGNVDWHGKNGWVLSWYGPRTRYLDASINLDPRVFFKGRVLVDMRDWIDPDVLVLGVSVASFPSGQWLVVVTEVPGTTRIERVSALPLAGKPADVTLTVGDAYVEVNSRTTTDINNLQHPWFFSPDGKEARQITRHVADLLERVITLVEDAGEEAGFRVERTSNTLTRPFVAQSSGYTSGAYTYHLTNQTILYRQLSTSGDPPIIDAYAGAFQTSPPCLDSWSLEDNAIASGDPWVAIAVDYAPDGTVVYGYGRAETGTDVESGTYTRDAGGGDVTPTFLSNTVTEITPGTWQYDAGVAYPDIAVQWHTTRARTRNYITAGLRVGAHEVVATSTLTSSGRSDNATLRTGSAISALATTTVTGYFDTTGGGVPDAALLPYAGGYLTAAAGVLTYELSRTVAIATTTYTESLYLLHMDLRYGALFYVLGQQTLQDHNDFTVDYRAYGDPVYLQTTVQTLQSGMRNAYLTRGWVGDALVLDDAIVTVDALDTPGSTSTSSDVPVDETEPVIDGVGNFPDSFDWDPGVPDFADLPGTLYDDAYWAPGAPTPVEAPPGIAYALDVNAHPFVQGDTLAWAAEIIPATSDGIIGYAFAPTFGNDAKFKWHFDADDRRFPGAVCCYQSAWLFSLALPAINDDAHAFRFVSDCSAGPVKPKIKRLHDPDFDHVYPVWVLAQTRAFHP